MRKKKGPVAAQAVDSGPNPYTNEEIAKRVEGMELLLRDFEFRTTLYDGRFRRAIEVAAEALRALRVDPDGRFDPAHTERINRMHRVLRGGTSKSAKLEGLGKLAARVDELAQAFESDREFTKRGLRHELREQGLTLAPSHDAEELKRMVSRLNWFRQEQAFYCGRALGEEDPDALLEMFRNHVRPGKQGRTAKGKWTTAKITARLVFNALARSKAWGDHWQKAIFYLDVDPDATELELAAAVTSAVSLGKKKISERDSEIA